MSENVSRETIRDLEQKICKYERVFDFLKIFLILAFCIYVMFYCIFTSSLFQYVIVLGIFLFLFGLNYIIYNYVEKELKKKLTRMEYIVFIPTNFAEVQMRNDLYDPLYLFLNKNLKKILIKKDVDYDLVIVRYFFKNEKDAYTMHMPFEKAKEIFDFS